MKQILLLGVALVLLPVWLHAEPIARPIQAYLVASAADALITGVVLSQPRSRGREGNPLFRPMAGRPVLLAGVRMGLAAGLAYGLHKAMPQHPRLATAMALIATGSVSAIALNNARFLRVGG